MFYIKSINRTLAIVNLSINFDLSLTYIDNKINDDDDDDDDNNNKNVSLFSVKSCKFLKTIITHQHTDARYCYSNSVSLSLSLSLSVCLSVCPSVSYVPVFCGNGLTYCHSFFTTQSF